MAANPESVQDLVTRRVAQAYSAGFVTDVESETIPIGLSEDVVRLISHRKNEPEWLLNSVSRPTGAGSR
jgi:Fe-S cluster assembly protein SufB